MDLQYTSVNPIFTKTIPFLFKRLASLVRTPCLYFIHFLHMYLTCIKFSFSVSHLFLYDAAKNKYCCIFNLRQHDIYLWHNQELWDWNVHWSLNKFYHMMHYGSLDLSLHIHANVNELIILHHCNSDICNN